MIEIRNELKRKNQTLVFTNGVFDVLHRGHVEYLEQAKSHGDVLVVGLNSDNSVRKIKGEGKPLFKQQDRALVLAGLSSVHYVVFFEEETPHEIISALLPDFLIKGGDYQIHEIVGRDVVEANGGQVVTVPITPGYSTSELIRKIAELLKKGKIAL
ncbi:MAG: D-glycero-beta-D-manno-heptose 1-phosphate adenylyltransferase [Calditrichaeota bacterium]|nr:D-glycero-beta-D-manno-heptose 1-phosphate adenylyltransferase [Calditrichota bacterium]RQV92615.1 MAG: D-glycero-beta-D-manno-heptose 1-phosphate adenylyltransferase [bacterium]RQV99847.1 MAG: D-glycero-beta-D-manno-heptose 1-phosphate adenylyltransferase [Calditrichota bacterium]